MSGKIRMNPDTMRERARQYQNEAKKISAVIKNMDDYVRMLLEEWEGESSKEYANKYFALKPGFQMAEDLINEISQSLERNANSFEDTDQQLARQFRF